MASSKALLCDLCVILLFTLTLVLAEDKLKRTKPTDEGPKGNCTCGGFKTAAPLAGTLPLLSQAPGLVMSCDQEGESTCRTLCVALATATKAKGPEVLCNKLENADELKLSAFYKACDNPWVYANMTADQPLCCKDSKVTACASGEQAADAATTVSIDAKAAM